MGPPRPPWHLLLRLRLLLLRLRLLLLRLRLLLLRLRLLRLLLLRQLLQLLLAPSVGGLAGEGVPLGGGGWERL